MHDYVIQYQANTGSKINSNTNTGPGGKSNINTSVDIGVAPPTLLKSKAPGAQIFCENDKIWTSCRDWRVNTKNTRKIID
jgi:hypothetical protein